MAVEARCTERCFVLFDDTWAGPAAGLYNGKGGLAVGFLMSKGFEVVQQSSGTFFSLLVRERITLPTATPRTVVSSRT